MTQPRLVLLHALSPIHCGTGQAIGGIELPIARERATKIPLIPGSSLKGVLRASASSDQKRQKLHRDAFGPDTVNAAEHAGAMQFSDLRLTLLPVRSLRGTFAWATSPYLLTRFARDARESGIILSAMPPAPKNEDSAFVTTGSLVVDEATKKVVLEEFDFVAEPNDAVTALGDWFARQVLQGESDEESSRFARRFLVIADDVMAQLLESSMEITTRIRLDPETKTVARGALWTEEALPVESVLSGLVACTPVGTKSETPADLMNYVSGLSAKALQIGGKASVGRGICRLHLVGEN